MTLREQRARNFKKTEISKKEQKIKEYEELFEILNPNIQSSLNELKNKYINNYSSYVIKIELRGQDKEIIDKFININNYNLLRAPYVKFLQQKLEEITNKEIDFNLIFNVKSRTVKWKGLFLNIPVYEYYIELCLNFKDVVQYEN